MMEVNKNGYQPENTVDTNNPPKLTREQRRIAERVQEEAKQASFRLCEKFFEYFLDNDPEGPELSAKTKELSTKWKMYCKQNHLNEEAYDLVDKYAAAILEEYHRTKNEDGNQVQEGTV